MNRNFTTVYVNTETSLARTVSSDGVKKVTLGSVDQALLYIHELQEQGYKVLNWGTTVVLQKGAPPLADETMWIEKHIGA